MFEHQGEHERERGQEDELGDEPDRGRLGLAQQAAEVLDVEVEGHAEHHQPDEDVEDQQAALVEVEPGTVDVLGEKDHRSRLLMHLLEVEQARRPHVLGGVDVDVDHRAGAAGQAALDGATQFVRGRHPLTVRPHGSRQVVVADLAEIGVDRRSGWQRLPDEHLQRCLGDRLGHLDHAPLPVAHHQEDRPGCRCAPRSPPPGGACRRHRRR